MHWPARQPPESVRDGVDTRRLVPLPPPRFIRGRSSRGRRRKHRDRAFVQGRQDPSRGRARVGRHRASACPDGSRFGARSVLRGISPTGWDRDLGVWAILVRRSRALGGVPRCAVVFPRVSSRARPQLRDPPRDLVSRPRPSLALPRVFPRGPVRAVEFHPVCTAFAPARHRTGRPSTVSVTASGTPAHAASFSPIIWRRAAPKRSGPAATDPHSTNGDTTRAAHINGQSSQPRHRPERAARAMCATAVRPERRGARPPPRTARSGGTGPAVPFEPAGGGRHLRPPGRSSAPEGRFL